MQNIAPHWFRLSLLTIAMLFATTVMAQEENLVPAPEQDEDIMDNVDISLITCEPHDMIYALYGHTGIRIHDRVTGEDMLANWGIFDQSKSLFAVRFAFGLTDYRMEIETWDGFVARYNYFRCGIREQILNLTNKEKRQIIQAIYTNYLPENRYYRYNFFYDNCTTRARNIIVENLDGEINYNASPEVTTPFRKEIHQWNENHKWARWGNDFLLGIGSDKKTDRNQQQFLPDTLRVDFNNAVITENGQQRKLVREEHWATPSQYDYDGFTTFDNMTEPYALACYLAIIMILIMIMEKCWLKRRLWQFDAFLLLLSGIPGIVLFAMIFSQHPTVSLNFQILVFNPLALIFGWRIIKSFRKGLYNGYSLILAFCFAAGFIAHFWQTFAEGVSLLALILMYRFSSSYGLKDDEKK